MQSKNQKSDIMKRLTSILVLFTLAMGLYFLNSCQDPCKDVECLNGGVCEDGECICAEGYEGENCGTEWREKFLGQWNQFAQCDEQNFTSSISKSTDNVKTVVISNILGTFGGNAKATINDENLIAIPEQQVIDNEGDPWTIKGLSTGTLSGNSFTINVQFTYGTNTLPCQLNFTKL